MKKYLLLLLIAFNVLAANASMTTKDVKRKDVIYTLVTVTEGSSWATVRTRGVSDGRENKITRYAVVKSSDLNAVGSIEIKDSIMDDGSSFNVIAISSHAFEDALVRYVSMPDGIYDIGTCAFKGCTSLAEVTVYASESGARAVSYDDEGVNSSGARRALLFSTEEIDDCAFEGCTSLTFVRLPSHIKKFGNRIFANCKRLKSVSFTSNVQNASVLVPSTALSSFGTEVFTGCRDINMVYADKSVQAISEDTFDDIVYARKNLSCPEDAEEKLKEMSGWKRFFFSGGPNNEKKTVEIADNAVKAICLANWDTNEDGVFTEDEAAAVTSLNRTFYQNEEIKTFEELSFFTGLKEIGPYEFRACKNLRSIKLPDNVMSIGYAAFADCNSLSDVDMPQTVNDIGAYAFYGCNSLTGITLPSAISRISKATFYGCSSLQNIDIPDNVTTIDSLAFMNCDQLSSISFSSKLNSINQGAFAACSKLKSITLPASLTFIGEQVFGACTSLEALIIPSKVQTIGLGIVGKCTSLTSLTVDSNNPYFYSKSNGIVDKRINMLVQSCKVTEIPTEVVGIADYGFIFVSGREEIIIPENVKSIGYDAFQDCDDLKRVTIPRAIESIGEEAFLDCESLERVTVLNPEPIAITDNVFQMQNDKYEPEGFTTATLYVPNGSKRKYQSSVGWKNFKNIVETESKTLTLMVNRCEREYGDDNPTFTYTAEGGAFTGEPEITCEATKTSPVGIYLITISKGSIDFDGKITFINANLSVTRATLTITADDKTMTAGDDMPELTVTYTGFKNNETEDVLIRKPTLRTTGSSLSSPGTYPIYVSGAYAANYLFKYVDGKLTIKKKEIVYDHVIFTANSYTRQYGESNPIFTYKSEGGSYTGEPIISCDATIKSPAGTYPIYISQGSVDNNNATFIQGTLTITKAPLVVTADDKTIVQGENIPELTISYDGFVNGETESVLKRKPVAVTTATINSEAGEYPIIVKGGVADNYEFYYKNGILTIEAQEPITHNRTLVMHLNNGNREKFVLSEQPLFVLSNEKLIVKISGMGAVYLRSDIKEFTFEENTDDILKAPAINEIIIRQLSNGDVSIYGLEIGAIVRVYDLNGASVYSSSPSTNEELIIPLGTRKSGIYIININNKRTIKIQKK